ncbi:MAG: type II toxin-antitoxin system VapC family toxin [Acidobacteriota bacterium]
MRILLDTCTFLWLTAGSRELSPTARRTFRSEDNELFLSAASAWEIALKHAAGRLKLASTPALFVPKERGRHGIEELTVTEADALSAGALPELHRDPFDRLLVAQALARGFQILTPDKLIARYPVQTIW